MAGQQENRPPGISRRAVLIAAGAGAVAFGGYLAEQVFPQLRGPVFESPTPVPTPTPDLEGWRKMTNAIEENYDTGTPVIIDGSPTTTPFILKVTKSVANAKDEANQIGYTVVENGAERQNLDTVAMCVAQLQNDLNPMNVIGIRIPVDGPVGKVIATLHEGDVIRPKQLTLMPIKIVEIKNNGNEQDFSNLPPVPLATKITL